MREPERAKSLARSYWDKPRDLGLWPSDCPKVSVGLFIEGILDSLLHTHGPPLLPCLLELHISQLRASRGYCTVVSYAVACLHDPSNRFVKSLGCSHQPGPSLGLPRAYHHFSHACQAERDAHLVRELTLEGKTLFDEWPGSGVISRQVSHHSQFIGQYADARFLPQFLMEGKALLEERP